MSIISKVYELKDAFNIVIRNEELPAIAVKIKFIIEIQIIIYFFN